MKLLDIAREDLACMQVIPDRSARSWRTQDLAKAIAELYRSPFDRFSFQRCPWRLRYEVADIVSFETVFTPERISYYLIGPQRLVPYLRRKAESIWDKATIQPAALPPALDPRQAICAELHYKRHDIFSMDTDARTNIPLPGLLSAAQDLQGEDRAWLQVLMEPVNRLEWEIEAGKAYERLRKGQMPRRVAFSARAVGHGLGLLVSAMLREVFGFISEFLSSDQSQQKQSEAFEPEARLLVTKGLTDATKPTSAILRAYVRLAAQSEEPTRAMLIAHGLAGAFKDLAADNELNRVDIHKGQERFLDQMNKRRPTVIRINGNILSVKEAGKLLQLPTAELQRDFPQIDSISRKEVSLPEELFLEGIKSIPLGKVTEKGVTRVARIPLEGYQGAQLKHVYDAVCTASFGQGKQGSGKSDGYGTNLCMGFVVNGLTAILIDTADGQVLKNFEDALPAEYPDWKLIHIELDNKAWPVALNWSDVLGREFLGAGGDKELEAMEVAERITARFKEFVASMATTEFTDRMEQYLSSCMKAVTTRSGWSFLDLELALKSPAYRAELLADPKVKSMPAVVDDLVALQDKAANGTAGSIVDFILSRLKMLSNSRFIENLFYQQPKINDKGKPVVDFRRWIDNKPIGVPVADGYGYTICIHASADAWGEDGQSLVLGFIEDKINFNVFSRVDQDQADRKPCVSWIDEPHKVIKSVARYYKNANVEFRKYRCKRIFTGHSIDQMGSAAKSLMEGGAQITSYKTESLEDLAKFGHIFKPYDEPKELYDQLPDKWVAVNKVRLPSNTECPAFIAEMMPPPAFVRSREARREACAKEFGRHWKEVSQWILERRQQYRILDEKWYMAKEKEREEAKEREREQKRREREEKKKEKEMR